MAMVVYGTRVFTKFAGYFGEKEECQNCHKTYKKRYVKNTTWAHLDYIPLFPVKKTYSVMCPICGEGIELKSKEAKEDMRNPDNTDNPEIELFAKHILEKKPKGIMATDYSYELWARDVATGEEFCIATDITKDVIKNVKKTRAYKKIAIIDA